MKREILFRGKKVATNEWVYGSLIINKSGLHAITQIMENPVQSGVIQGWCYGVTPETTAQFTGIKDKNGVKIFEGDVIEEGIVCWNDEYLGFFAKGDFAEGENKPLYDILFPEIVGNIHDNPDKK